MRIHYLSDSVVPSLSANSVHVMKMCSAFARLNHQVVLSAYCNQRSEEVFGYYGVQPEFDISGILHSRVPGLRRSLRALNGSVAVRAASSPDLIYGRDLYSMVTATFGNIPFVYEAHMAPLSSAGRLITHVLLRRKNLKRLVLISQGLADAFAELYPWFSAKKLMIAHDAADSPGPSSGGVSVAEWPGRESTPQVGYVGSLHPGKGSEVVLELARRLPEFDFHIVGGRPDQVERIRTESREPNLFLHGHVEPQYVLAYLNRLDIALLPPQKHVRLSKKLDIGAWMSPLKLFEYMAAKRPIVSSSLPVIEEVLTDGVNAVLVPADDLEAWAGAVRRLAADVDGRAALADRAFRDFTSMYTWQARAGRVLEGL